MPAKSKSATSAPKRRLGLESKDPAELPAPSVPVQRYTLELTEGQARLVARALELYARLCMGQFTDIIFNCFPGARSKNQEMADEAEGALRRAKELLTGLQGWAYHSMTSREIPDSARNAWDIYTVIRNRLAWDRNPKGDYTVDFREPDHLGPEPEAKIRRGSSEVERNLPSGG